MCAVSDDEQHATRAGHTNLTRTPAPPEPGATSAPLFVPINHAGDVRCRGCGAVNTWEGDSFDSYGGTTEWWERCTACGRADSGADLSAVR